MRSTVFAALIGLGLLGGFRPAAAAPERVDAALVLAIDVSGSVDDERYTLQMQGIAAAFSDPQVAAAIVGGPRGSMLVTVVEWSTRPKITIPWTLLTRPEDVYAMAAKIRHTVRVGDQFTCMATALQYVADKALALMPIPADRVVVDVSGDGSDNCNPTRSVRQVAKDLSVTANATINGLPILEGEEAKTLEAWYSDNVIAGSGAFVMPAMGFRDIERAMRQKFILEVSGQIRPPG